MKQIRWTIKYRSLIYVYLVRPMYVSHWPIIPTIMFIHQIILKILSKITRPWNIGHADLYLLWGQSLSHTVSLSENITLMLVGWLCWGLTSQSTIFQSYRDGAIASWVINQYFRGVKCLAQGHNTAAVGLEPRTSRSGVRHSTTEPPRSP